MSNSHRQNRQTSDFSIAKILGDDLPINNDKNINNNVDNCRNECVDAVRVTKCDDKSLKISDNIVGAMQTNVAASTPLDYQIKYQEKFVNSPGDIYESTREDSLHWLHCTRYRPPKLPRKTTTNSKNIKRRPAKHPRIPFTTFQLEILEKQYKNKAYLMRKDVQQLSNQLRLPQSRVKIWFQNRRARDRRDKKIINSLTIK